MKDPTVSHHLEHLRALPTYYRLQNLPYRPSVNLQELAQLAQSAPAIPLPREGGDVGHVKGKKRARSPSSSDHSEFNAKRSKTAAGSSSSRHDPCPTSMEYPFTSACSNVLSSPEGSSMNLDPDVELVAVMGESSQNPKRKLVPAFKHVFEIEYTEADDGSSRESHFSNSDEWIAEEEWFRRQLKGLGRVADDTGEPRTLDLGCVCVDRIRLAFSRLSPTGFRYVVTKDDIWLALIPQHNPDSFSSDALDLNDDASEDLVHCIYTLVSDGRVAVDARLKLIIIPEEVQDGQRPPLLSFRLHLELSVSFVTPHIFKPLSDVPARSRKQVEDFQRRLLHYVFPPTPPPPSFEGMVNIPFYYACLGPAPPLDSLMAQDAMQPAGLLPTLLPFQRRSVGWLLDREGMKVSEDGRIVPKERNTGFSFWQEVDVDGEKWWFHRLTSALQSYSPFEGSKDEDGDEDEEVPRGGILAEEPGLGKTIETIALILLNPALPQFNPALKRWDAEAELDVRAVKSTLIVTPPALATQWRDELRTHAPTLKVLVYDGWNSVKVPITQKQIEKVQEDRQKEQVKKARRQARAGTKAEAEARIKAAGTAKGKGKGKGKAKAKDEDDYEDEHAMDVDLKEGLLNEGEIVDWVAHAHSFDVVITTYNVLQSDLNVARAPPTRPRRGGVVYANVDRPRSPLVLVEWNRVVMDEVQMAGGAKIEDMVSLIPRRSSLAVSGTPARAQVSDLSHVLKFLRIDIGSRKLWNRLLLPGFAGDFHDLFKYHCVRTMKSQVSEELTIPQQTRYLVSIDLGRVERLVYDQTFEGILNELGLDARGIAASDGWEVDGALLRSSIRRLRGICTHPQVGQLNQEGQNQKLYKPGALKTMADVLQNMKDQNWRNLLDDWKAKVQSLIKIAQLKQLDTQTVKRFQPVLETLLLAEKDADKMIEEIQRVIVEHDAKGEILKQEYAAERALRKAQHPGVEDPSDKGKGKQRAESPADLSDEEEDDDDEDNDLPKTPAGKEHANKRRVLKHRLREANVVYHRVKFLQGDVYHNLGSSTQENDAYAVAENVRKDLLKTTEQDAKHGMAELKIEVTKSGVSKQELLIPVPFLEQGGIRSAEAIEELHGMIEDVLNEQTELLWEWRGEIHSLLTASLSPEGNDDADGQEYQRNLDNQGEAETYLQAYSALLADRREALLNERTLLAAYETRETKQRKTKAALKATAVADTIDIPADVEIQPEHEVLYKQLSEKRKVFLADMNGRAVKSTLVELTQAYQRITRDNDPEKDLLKDAISSLRRLITSQQSMMEKLDLDLALFRKAFNQRVLYFRQLQEISDSVADVEFEGARSDAVEASQKEAKELETKITATRAHQRYLDHLVRSNDDNELDEEDKCCILCRCDFERGFITTCAHIFCEGCLKSWMQKKEGKSCPVCRIPIDMDKLQRFKLSEPEQPPARNPIVNGELLPVSRRKIDYNMIKPHLFEEIQSMEAIGDYGSKIQTLVRHLLYLQDSEPGTKSIVFSAWADSLHIVDRALRDNGIKSIRIDKGGKGEGPVKKFKTDPEALVLLLHGERENAGLNVTCASRVFLLESVVHHGFEIQAIARIDRMGQTRPTEVFCYYAEDTLERNILDLAARQGLSLYTKENSAGTLNVSSFAANLDNSNKQGIDSPSKNSKARKGDFISKIDDMLAVLFPHMFEDVEYLLAPEDITMSDVTNTHDDSTTTRQLRKTPSVTMNAVAGPSRLRA